MDLDEDSNILIIHDRLFLATFRALINVEKGKLMIRLDEDKVNFKVNTTNECFVIDVKERNMKKIPQKIMTRVHLR